MGIEGLKDMIDIVGKVFKESKTIEMQENNEFLNSKSTQSLIQYLNSIYKPEEIQQELGGSLQDYITRQRNNSLENGGEKWIGVIETFVPEIPLRKLKNEIINNENIGIIQTGFQMVSGEQSPIKTLVYNYITATEKDKYLQSLGISLAPQEEIKPIINKNTTTENENNNISIINSFIEINKIDIEKIKEGIFASESQHEKEPYKANNPKSSAIGKYQFLWNSRKDKIKEITKITNEKDYINNPEQQELFMDYIIQNIYLPKAKEYQKDYTSWKLPELIMLIHFKGEKGALDWIKDKKDNTITNNISIDKYINNFQKEYYA